MNLIHSLAETAKNNGQKTAYVFEDKQTSYAELQDAVTRFASGLAKLGVRKGHHVALVLGNSPYFVTALYGALAAGASVIPINPIYTPDEIEYIIENGDVHTIVALDALLPVIEQLDVPSVQNVIVCRTGATSVQISKGVTFFEDALASGESHFEGPSVTDDDVAVILYTSGTTGKPKGAMLTHLNLYSNARDVGLYLKYSEHDRVFATLPLFHVFCLTVALNASLVYGATILLMPKFSPAEVFRIAKDYEATVFAGVPTMYNFLLQYPDGKVEDFAHLRLCISGGAAMPVALLENFEKKFNVPISEGYGLSEASPVTCFNALDKPRRAGSIGTSIINVENKVVDIHGNEVPIGDVGELVVRGPNVMKGYYKLPEKTAETIIDGWLYTGDMAKRDEDGYFYIVDRKKDMIIVGGYNVYPREVEEVVYSHPSIVEAVVVGVPDDSFGEEVRVFAVRKDESLSEAELIQYCTKHLAKYKVPKRITFIAELPKNATGKILRRALKEA